jgi:hypothetical protein
MKTTIATLSLFASLFATSVQGDPKAGFVTSEAALSVGDVPITVWYPTSSKVKGPSEYVVPEYVLVGDEIGPPVELKIPAGAARDAPIKGGDFPLILSNPGGEAGNHMRLRNYPNNELLAERGYIVVEAGRNVTDFIVDAELLRSLIDYMLSEHELSGSIDANKIGARGLSFGSDAVHNLAGSWSGVPADERVRGIIIDEGYGCDFFGGFYDCSAVTIPVMLRDGSLLPDFGNMAPSFAAFVNAFPRFLVTLDNPAHTGFSTGTCGTVEAQRQASLEYQAVSGGIVQPEPRDLGYIFSPPEAWSIGDTAGYSASIFWNLNFFIPNIGSYGDFCRAGHGGPEPFPATPDVMDNQTMIETKHELNLAFWKTVFGNGQSNNRVEKAVEKLDSVIFFDQVTE